MTMAQYFQQQAHNMHGTGRVPSWFDINARQAVPFYDFQRYAPIPAPRPNLDDFLDTLGTATPTGVDIIANLDAMDGVNEKLVSSFIHMSLKYWY